MEVLQFALMPRLSLGKRVKKPELAVQELHYHAERSRWKSRSLLMADMSLLV